MTKEDRREIAVKGLFIGLILFVSMLIALLINKDMQNLQIVGTFLIPIILGYCTLGIFIRWMVYRSTLRKKGSHLFSCPAIVYWVFMLSAIFTAGAYGIPQVIRYIVVANLGSLLLIWLLDCLYLKNIAKELNSGLGNIPRILIEDLQEKPKTEEIFIKEIENYCIKNNLSLEIIEHGIPCKVKMDNIQYTVQLGQYYTLLGTIVYTLEFHNRTSKRDI